MTAEARAVDGEMSLAALSLGWAPYIARRRATAPMTSSSREEPSMLLGGSAEGKNYAARRLL